MATFPSQFPNSQLQSPSVGMSVAVLAIKTVFLISLRLPCLRCQPWFPRGGGFSYGNFEMTKLLHALNTQQVAMTLGSLLAHAKHSSWALPSIRNLLNYLDPNPLFFPCMLSCSSWLTLQLCNNRVLHWIYKISHEKQDCLGPLNRKPLSLCNQESGGSNVEYVVTVSGFYEISIRGHEEILIVSRWSNFILLNFFFTAVLLNVAPILLISFKLLKVQVGFA